MESAECTSCTTTLSDQSSGSDERTTTESTHLATNLAGAGATTSSMCRSTSLPPHQPLALTFPVAAVILPITAPHSTAAARHDIRRREDHHHLFTM